MHFNRDLRTTFSVDGATWP